MDNEQMLDRLKDLMQLDYDAVQAYDKVIQKLDDPAVRGKIESFRDDHIRHVNDLDAMIVLKGGRHQEPSRDFKGVLLESVAKLRSMTGTIGTLKANEMAEKQTNKRYAEAVRQDFPTEVMALVSRNYEDERRHLDYIQRTLAERA